MKPTLKPTGISVKSDSALTYDAEGNSFITRSSEQAIAPSGVSWGTFVLGCAVVGFAVAFYVQKSSRREVNLEGSDAKKRYRRRSRQNRDDSSVDTDGATRYYRAA